MTNPYRFVADDQNGLISFSGGRTSGYLLKHVIDAYGGELPSNIKVTFCNTGREMPQTLDFVQACQEKWGVWITWLEFRPGSKFEIVDYSTASRNGEPFEYLVHTPLKRRDKTIGPRPLPNPVGRSCTGELKVRTMRRYMAARDAIPFVAAIGLRGDEGHRVAKSSQTPGQTKVFPMFAAGVTNDDVLAFWAAQPFDLDLKVDKKGATIEGNCDLCFMKSAAKVSAMAARYPERAKWWADMEARQALTDRATTFRQDRPTYAEMLAAVERGEPMDFGIFDDLTSCGSHGCTD